MKRIFLLLSLVLLSGCLAVRTYTLEKPRVDTEIQGNRGCLQGICKQEVSKKSRLGKTRKIGIVEVEFTSAEVIRQDNKKEKTVYKKKHKEDDDEENIWEDEYYEEQEEDEQEEAEFFEKAVRKTKPLPKKQKHYTIQKGDTLQKVSQKFYGTTKKWKFLYEVNKDVLKSADKVYPGARIKIPDLN